MPLSLRCKLTAVELPSSIEASALNAAELVRQGHEHVHVVRIRIGMTRSAWSEPAPCVAITITF